MQCRRFGVAILLAGAAALPARAQDLLVSVDWLAQHRSDPNLVLLHVGDRAEYDTAHIAGARFIEMGDVSTPRDPNALSLELPAPQQLRSRLEELGIDDNSRIVVYYGNDWVSPSTRIILTLDYLGLGTQTSLLNGGMRAWRRAGHTTTAERPTITRGRLSERPVKSDMIVTADFVRGVPQRNGHVLLDGRATAFYEGTMPANGKEGHIPGAKTLPFTVLANDEMMVDRAALESAYRAAGVKPGDIVVAYCHIGQQATAVLFGARLLGHTVRLYDGSFQDWANRNLPVEKQ